MPRNSSFDDRSAGLSDAAREALERRLSRGVAALSPPLASNPFSPSTHPSPTAPAQRKRPAPVSWKSVLACGREEAATAAGDPDLIAHAGNEPDRDRLSVGLVCEALHGLGAFTTAAEAHSPDDLVRRHGVLPEFRKVLVRWLLMLKDAGLVEQQGDTFVAPAPLPACPTDVRLSPEDERYYYFAHRLEDLLTGRRHPLEAFLPGDSSEAVEADYVRSPMFRYCNRVAAAVVGALMQKWPSERTVSVFEVGAGTGGTTAGLLPLFPADRTTYVYTDISTFFTTIGRGKFGDQPFVQFGKFNVEIDPAAQGYPTHAFDLVVAAHVLHATRSIRETTRHVRRLLAPGGLLLLLEETRFRRVFNFGMGFLPGFDRFDDKDLRQTHPLLSSAQWCALLGSEGFARSAALTEPGSPIEQLGVDVLLAQADDGSSSGVSVPL